MGRELQILKKKKKSKKKHTFLSWMRFLKMIMKNNSEVQMRAGIEDNSKITFFLTKTYVVTPH